jgi:hypothetical protein
MGAQGSRYETNTDTATSEYEILGTRIKARDKDKGKRLITRTRISESDDP